MLLSFHNLFKDVLKRTLRDQPSPKPHNLIALKNLAPYCCKGRGRYS